MSGRIGDKKTSGKALVAPLPPWTVTTGSAAGMASVERVGERRRERRDETRRGLSGRCVGFPQYMGFGFTVYDNLGVYGMYTDFNMRTLYIAMRFVSSRSTIRMHARMTSFVRLYRSRTGKNRRSIRETKRTRGWLFVVVRDVERGDGASLRARGGEGAFQGFSLES